MEKVITSLALISTILITACNNKNVDYYNKLVDINNTIAPQRIAFGKETAKAGKADSATLVNIIDTLIPTLKSGMASICALQSTTGGKELQQKYYALDSAILVSVEAVKKIVTVKMTEEETSELNSDLIDNAANIQRIDSSLKQTIAAYVKANDITLEEN